MLPSPASKIISPTASIVISPDVLEIVPPAVNVPGAKACHAEPVVEIKALELAGIT